MTTARSYGERCAIAHALDLVGERWTLLVVRELLLGPKRFSDLRGGMPYVSPDVLARRLRELDHAGVVRRRKLPPPASAWVYELTEWGLDLEPVLVHLGRWGSRSRLFGHIGVASVDSVMLALRSLFDAEASGDLSASYELRFDEDRFSVRVDDGRLEVARGEAAQPDAIVETDPDTFSALFTGRQRVRQAICGGRLRLTGDADRVQRLFDACVMPEPATSL